jgi:hypothetical protein
MASISAGQATDREDAISLRRCEWMLSERGCSFAREAEIFSRIPNRGKKPDFLVTAPGICDFLVEVESFREPTALDRMEADVMFVADATPQQRIDRRVRAAAAQLSPYRDLGLPLVVVLDNHRQVRLEGLGLEALVPLFGSGAGSAWNPDAPLLRGERDYVSAVVVNEPSVRFDEDYGSQPFTTSRPMRVLAVHNPHATTPLPLSMLAGGTARQFVQDRHGWRLA